MLLLLLLLLFSKVYVLENNIETLLRIEPVRESFVMPSAFSIRKEVNDVELLTVVILDMRKLSRMMSCIREKWFPEHSVFIGVSVWYPFYLFSYSR